MIVLVIMGIGLVCAAGFTFLGGLLTFAYEFFIWLRSGAWESVRVNDIISEPWSDSTIQWLVVQIALQSPLSLVLLILSIPLFFFGLLVENLGGRNLRWASLLRPAPHIPPFFDRD